MTIWTGSLQFCVKFGFRRNTELILKIAKGRSFSERSKENNHYFNSSINSQNTIDIMMYIKDHRQNFGIHHWWKLRKPFVSDFSTWFCILVNVQPNRYLDTGSFLNFILFPSIILFLRKKLWTVMCKLINVASLFFNPSFKSE